MRSCWKHITAQNKHSFSLRFTFTLCYLWLSKEEKPLPLALKINSDNTCYISGGILNTRHMIKGEFVFNGIIKLKLFFVFISSYS